MPEVIHVRMNAELFNFLVDGRLLRVPGLQGDPSVHPKGNQSWVFIGRTDAKAETPIPWPPDVKS